MKTVEKVARSDARECVAVYSRLTGSFINKPVVRSGQNGHVKGFQKPLNGGLHSTFHHSEPIPVFTNAWVEGRSNLDTNN